MSSRGRKEITIDVDATNDSTHGNQQLSLFHGYYGQFMYNELLFHNSDTGHIIYLFYDQATVPQTNGMFPY